MTPPIVKAGELVKNFNGTEVLRGISFEVSAGETVCVWGPSGAGKSTLLHVMGLLTPPSGGRLELFGRKTVELTEKEADKMRNERLGFLFQFHHLLPDLTLLENVIIPLSLRRVAREESEAKARPLLGRLGLSHRLHHRPSETSGGEQQRAALARALIGEPRVILADEPTGNLDRGIGREVEGLLKSEAESRGAALILVTHNEQLAAQADRRLVLIDGKLQTE